jgi:hypothetical protein
LHVELEGVAFAADGAAAVATESAVPLHKTNSLRLTFAGSKAAILMASPLVTG